MIALFMTILPFQGTPTGSPERDKFFKHDDPNKQSVLAASKRDRNLPD